MLRVPTKTGTSSIRRRPANVRSIAYVDRYRTVRTDAEEDVSRVVPRALPNPVMATG
jgi:hypothetical protein